MSKYELDILFSDIKENDRHFIKIGNTFKIEDDDVSTLEFFEPIAFTDEEIKKAMDEAENFYKNLRFS